MACMESNIEIVKFLLEKGADANASDYSGKVELSFSFFLFCFFFSHSLILFIYLFIYLLDSTYCYFT